MPKPTIRPCKQCGETYDRQNETRCPGCDKAADEPVAGAY